MSYDGYKSNLCIDENSETEVVLFILIREWNNNIWLSYKLIYYLLTFFLLILRNLY
jgi:hypothetical protein